MRKPPGKYKGNPNNIIAVIDGGVQANHVDLDNKISGGDTGFGWDGHGTHVAGIAAAESNNSQGVSGVDWNARIHPKRIDNISSDADTYQAIVDAVNFSPNVHVINHSWGLEYANEDPGRYSITVRQAFAYAYKANRTSVVAMGNHQQTHPNVVNYPAGFGNVIAVGATNNNDVIAGFSAQGNHIDVSAPGVGILSTLNGDYATDSGTSMAAPFVSGIASLLKGYDPDLANDDIENIIKLSSDDKGLADFDNAYGFGRVNAEEALKFLEAPYSLSQLTATSGSAVSSTEQSQVVFMGAGSLASATYIAKRYEVRKDVDFPDDYLNVEGVWGRGVFTTGWNISNPNFGEGFCEVVPGTLTNTGATLRTYVYQIWSVTGSYLGYYPQSPSNVEFAYTVLGVKAPTLSGPETLCNNTTYTLNELPDGASVSWSTSSNIEIVSSSNSDITVKPKSASTRRDGQITYTINSSYGQGTSSKTVYIGKPTIYTLNSDGTKNYMGTSYSYPVSHSTREITVHSDTPFTTYTWDMFPTNIQWQGVNNKATFYVNVPGNYLLTAKAVNDCGESIMFFYITIGGNNNYAIYPNPASNEINIEKTTGDQISGFAQSSTYTIATTPAQLFNFNGVLVKTIEIDPNENITTLDVSGLKEGLYFLIIGVGEEQETYKIIVAR